MRRAFTLGRGRAGKDWLAGIAIKHPNVRCGNQSDHSQRHLSQAYRGENAKEKANAVRTYWVPGVNNVGKFGRWAFAEFTAVYEIERQFAALIGRFTKNQAAA